MATDNKHSSSLPHNFQKGFKSLEFTTSYLGLGGYGKSNNVFVFPDCIL